MGWHRPAPSFLFLMAILVLGWSSTAFGQDDLLDDDLGLLYSSQVQFGTDGIPRVTIGLMDDQDKVVVRGPSGMSLQGKVELDGQLVSRRLHSRPGEAWRFEAHEPTKAQVRYWCAVASVPFAEKEKLKEVMGIWKGRFENLQVFEVGGVFGVHGHVIDNRTYILGIRDYDSERAAELAAEDVFNTYGERSFVHAHLARRPSGGVRVQRLSGGPVETFVDLVVVRSNGKEPVQVDEVEFGRGYKRHGRENRSYNGDVIVTLDRQGKLVVVNRIAIDELLNGLVPVEIFPTAPMEALKAQAVVARGEVFAKLGTRHFLDPYLLCAATHCQVYSGRKVKHPRASAAVTATRGQLLFLGPDLVDSVYSASCGGHGEDNDAVWSDPPSKALRGRPDAASRPVLNLSDPDRLKVFLENPPKSFCRTSSFNRKKIYRWERSIPSEKLDALVAKTQDVGHVVSIQILSRGVSGRVKVVRVVGEKGDLVMQREWPVRKLFGNLKSGMFLVKSLLDAKQNVIGFHFLGGGWGHGVGMCQIGATGMAQQGYDYQQILAHYYGGAEVVRLYGAEAIKE